MCSTRMHLMFRITFNLLSCQELTYVSYTKVLQLAFEWIINLGEPKHSSFNIL